MKLFVSLQLPPFIKKELIRIQEELKKLNAFTGSYIPYENLHCTVFFIGEVPEPTLSLIKDRLISSPLPSCNNLVLGPLSFNSSKQPHVLWVSLDSSSLQLLAQQIADLLPEWSTKRTFVGHITLVRIKKLIEKEAISHLTLRPLHWDADAVHLQESKATHEGSLYITHVTIPLV